jgi:hypothetical protein
LLSLSHLQGGKVNGSLQRASGKIAMTIQIVNAAKVTTSFNFAGMMDSSGSFVGTFSGTEISRNAGTVTGGFRGSRMSDEDAAKAEERREAGEASEDDEDEESDSDSAANKKAAAKKVAAAPAPKAKPAAKPAASKTKRKKDDSDSETDSD